MGQYVKYKHHQGLNITHVIMDAVFACFGQSGRQLLLVGLQHSRLFPYYLLTSNQVGGRALQRMLFCAEAHSAARCMQHPTEVPQDLLGGSKKGLQHTCTCLQTVWLCNRCNSTAVARPAAGCECLLPASRSSSARMCYIYVGLTV